MGSEDNELIQGHSVTSTFNAILNKGHQITQLGIS